MNKEQVGKLIVYIAERFDEIMALESELVISEGLQTLVFSILEFLKECHSSE